jgi:hypothetical protein
VELRGFEPLIPSMRMDTDTVTEQQTVNEEVRKVRIASTWTARPAATSE